MKKYWIVNSGGNKLYESDDYDEALKIFNGLDSKEGIAIIDAEIVLSKVDEILDGVDLIIYKGYEVSKESFKKYFLAMNGEVEYKIEDCKKLVI